jgi:putative transposase
VKSFGHHSQANQLPKPVTERRRRTLGGKLQKRLLDHIIVLNVRHLQRLMNEYISYYHEDRTHLALEKETPAGRVTAKNSGAGSRVILMPRLGGLHHRYDLAA